MLDLRTILSVSPLSSIPKPGMDPVSRRHVWKHIDAIKHVSAVHRRNCDVARFSCFYT